MSPRPTGRLSPIRAAQSCLFGVRAGVTVDRQRREPVAGEQRVQLLLLALDAVARDRAAGRGRSIVCRHSPVAADVVDLVAHADVEEVTRIDLVGVGDRVFALQALDGHGLVVDRVGDRRERVTRSNPHHALRIVSSPHGGQRVRRPWWSSSASVVACRGRGRRPLRCRRRGAVVPVVGGVVVVTVVGRGRRAVVGAVSTAPPPRMTWWDRTHWSAARRSRPRARRCTPPSRRRLTTSAAAASRRSRITQA